MSEEIIVTSEGGAEQLLPPEGQHLAYCYGVLVLGTVPGFQGKMVEQIAFMFELPLAKAIFDQNIGEQPFAFNKTFTRSLHKQSNMRPFVDQWRGKPLTDEEAVGFNVVSLMSIPTVAQIIIGEAKTSKRKYVDAMSITPAMQLPNPPPQRSNPTIVWSWGGQFDVNKFLTIPLWIRNIMITSTEFVNLKIPIPMKQGESFDQANGKVVKSQTAQAVQAAPVVQQTPDQAANAVFGVPTQQPVNPPVQLPVNPPVQSPVQPSGQPVWTPPVIPKI